MKKTIKFAGLAVVIIVVAVGVIGAIHYSTPKAYDRFGVRHERIFAVVDNKIKQSIEDDFLKEIGDAPIKKIDANGCLAALTRRGTVTADLGYEEARKWKKITDIAVGHDFIAGLKKDGSVVVEGAQNFIHPETFKNIKILRAGGYHLVGIDEKGYLYATGFFDDDQINFQGWTDIVDVACGIYSTYGIKKDGTVVSTGKDAVHDLTNFTDIKQMSVSRDHVVGLKKDGTVVAVGSNEYGQCDVSELKDVLAVKASLYNTVVVFKDGSMKSIGANDNNQEIVNTFNLGRVR